jgi:hypothetical protein
MSAKQLLQSDAAIEEGEEQVSSRPGRRRRRPGKRKIILFGGLALLFLLASLLATRLMNWGSEMEPVPFQPVGDVTVVNGPGFDTCVAPPADLLQTWWITSPYRWLNIYLGGASMFPTCGGKNLTPAWVRSVYAQGWSLLPTWVGAQSPCAPQHAVMSNNAIISYEQGRAEASAAIAAVMKLGFSNTAPIYFDMEHFNPGKKDGSPDTSCIRAVNAFLYGWTYELTSRNHLAGVYASASNYPVLDSTSSIKPGVAWIAGGSLWAGQYDRTCTVYGNKYLSDDAWNAHQRVYQYTGGHDETYGGRTWNIDSDCADAPMVGHITTLPIEVQFQHP